MQQRVVKKRDIPVAPYTCKYINEKRSQLASNEAQHNARDVKDSSRVEVALLYTGARGMEYECSDFALPCGLCSYFTAAGKKEGRCLYVGRRHSANPVHFQLC